MNETEKKIADKILNRIEDTCNSEQIANYLQFLQAIKLRLEINAILNSSS